MDNAVRANALAVATKGYSTEAIKSAIAQSSLNAEQIKAILSAKGLTETEIEEIIATSALAASQKGATASTLGLGAAFKGLGVKIKSTAKNMITWLATTPAGWATAAIAAIGAVALGLNKLAKAEKDASDKAQEAYEKSKERVQSNKEEAKSLDELIRKYEELKSSSNISSDNRSEIKELQYDIVDLVGAEAKNLDLVNGKLDEELRKLKEISAEKSRQNVEEARNNYNKAVYTSDVMVGDSDDYGNDVNVKWLGTESKQIHKANGFEQINFDDFVDFVIESGFGDIFRKNYDENIFNMRFVVDTKDIDGLESKVKRLEEFKDFLAESGLKNTELYQGVSDAIERYQSQTNYELEAVNTLTDSLIDDLSINNKKLSEITVDSMEDFEQYRQTMISEIKSDEDIGEALAEGLLSEEAIERAVNDFMATANEFSDWYVKWQESLTGSVEGKTSTFDLTTYKDQIDDFQSKVKTLGDALSSIRSGKFEDADLTDLLQEFPELTDKSDDLEAALVELLNNSLMVLYDTLGDEAPDSLKVSLQELTDIASGAAVHLNDAFSSIHDSWDVLQDFKDAMASGFDANITDSLLQSVRDLNGELETLVAGYYSGVVTAEELYEALTKHYENDLQNYSEALIKKNDLNTDFYNAVGMASEEVINQFMDDYSVDLENCNLNP